VLPLTRRGSAGWLARLPWEQEGDVATNKERLLSRRREGEAAEPAVQMEMGYVSVLKLIIGSHQEFVA